MKCVIQRVKDARLTVEDKLISSIDEGLLIYWGVAKGDGPEKVTYLCNKIAKLRLFTDAEGKQNLSSYDVQAKLMVVSQFTLCADLFKGNRPSYDKAASGQEAEPLYELALRTFRKLGFQTVAGVFGAHMMINYTNVGPLTMVIEK
ncbi:MAG: D-aminoacyl-tRNA deacylase [Spirochaetia bacterium]|jgi:D-tyrosyl-tRNA(Tyr) deacylase|nr:D-aminoacyl-tRNA deacylase [Spirochaetia bacterium]